MTEEVLLKLGRGTCIERFIYLIEDAVAIEKIGQTTQSALFSMCSRVIPFLNSSRIYWYTTSKNKELIIITSDLNNVPNIIIIKPKPHRKRIPIVDQGTIKHGIPLLYLKNCSLGCCKPHQIIECWLIISDLDNRLTSLKPVSNVVLLPFSFGSTSARLWQH